jgi:hypothetical protein
VADEHHVAVDHLVQRQVDGLSARALTWSTDSPPGQP